VTTLCDARCVDARLAAAVIDNARWCHLVCSTHGITGRFDADAWVSARRTPPLYPDAVTLTDDVSVEALLSRVDRSAGCSIKDSFSTLGLTGAGFRVLFDAQWIWCAAAPRPAPDALRWERVERPDDLRAWSVEHGGGSTFSPALLDEPSVSILARRDRGGGLVSGAVATEAAEAIGISNVFAVGAGDDSAGAASAFADAFAGAAAAIVGRFPGRPVVGYLSTDDLAAARAAGFETIGSLRIWLL
jgi:hypothetical protein